MIMNPQDCLSPTVLADFFVIPKNIDFRNVLQVLQDGTVNSFNGGRDDLKKDNDSSVKFVVRNCTTCALYTKLLV